MHQSPKSLFIPADFILTILISYFAKIIKPEPLYPIENRGTSSFKSDFDSSGGWCYNDGNRIDSQTEK